MGDARDRSTRPRETLDVTGRDGITGGRHHDRDGAGGTPARRDGRVTTRHDDIHLELDELSGQLVESAAAALGVTVLDEDGGSGRPAELAQPALEGFSLHGGGLRGASGAQHADAGRLD